MKPEAKLRSYWASVLNRLGARYVQHERIENAAVSGTPDYAYCCEGVNGWIEFKVAQPVDADKPLNLKHWTAQQRAWVLSRKESRSVFFILRVGDYDYIIDTSKIHMLAEVAYRNLKLISWCIPHKDAKYWNDINMCWLIFILKGLNYGGAGKGLIGGDNV